MKKILSLVLALCMVFTLFACGAKEEAPAATEAPAAPAAPAEAPKANDYSSMPEFDFNPQDGFFANNYAPKETFGENR